MTDLHMDTDAVSTAGVALRSAGWALGTDTDLALAACGSSTVSTAADDWAMWAKATILLLQGATTSSGQDAIESASTFAAQEAELAGAAENGG